MNFGKCKFHLEGSLGFRDNFEILDLKFKVSRWDDSKKFRLVKNLTMGEANFNHKETVESTTDCTIKQ